MQHWQPIDKRGLGRKALRRVIRELKKMGRLRLLSDTLGKTVGHEELTGFNIFTDVGPDSPHSWMLPRLTCDEADLIGAYEAFVAQPLGLVKSPGKVAERLLDDAGVKRVQGALNAYRGPDTWFHAAVRLVALGQSIPGAQLDTDWTTNTFTVILDSASMSVAPDKVFSNFTGDYVPVAVPVEEPLKALAILAPVHTDNRTLVALHRAFRGMPSMQMTVRVLAECLEMGQLTETEIKSEIRKAWEVGLLKGVDHGVPIGEAREQAALAAVQALGGESEGLMGRLYKAIVPLLFTSSEFAREFGSTAQVKRQVRLATLEAWAAKITARAERLTLIDQPQQEKEQVEA